MKPNQRPFINCTEGTTNLFSPPLVGELCASPKIIAWPIYVSGMLPLKIVAFNTWGIIPRKVNSSQSAVMVESPNEIKATSSQAEMVK